MFIFGLVVPTPTLPLRAVVVTASLPNTTVFEPIPKAFIPITIWFTSPEALARAKRPIYIEPLVSVSEDVPVPKYLPALLPIATLSLPIRLFCRVVDPNDTLWLPEVEKR